MGKLQKCGEERAMVTLVRRKNATHQRGSCVAVLDYGGKIE